MFKKLYETYWYNIFDNSKTFNNFYNSFIEFINFCDTNYNIYNNYNYDKSKTEIIICTAERYCPEISFSIINKFIYTIDELCISSKLVSSEFIIYEYLDNNIVKDLLKTIYDNINAKRSLYDFIKELDIDFLNIDLTDYDSDGDLLPQTIEEI